MMPYANIVLLGAPIAGLAGHEAIRFYVGLWNGKPEALAPLSRPLIYCFTLVVLGSLMVFFAEILQISSMSGRIAVGFSITTLPGLFGAGAGATRVGHKIEADDHSDLDDEAVNQATSNNRDDSNYEKNRHDFIRAIGAFYWY